MRIAIKPVLLVIVLNIWLNGKNATELRPMVGALEQEGNVVFSKLKAITDATISAYFIPRNSSIISTKDIAETSLVTGNRSFPE